MKVKCVNCQVKGVQERLKVKGGKTHSEPTDQLANVNKERLDSITFVPYSVDKKGNAVQSHWVVLYKLDPEELKFWQKEGKHVLKGKSLLNVIMANCPQCGSPTLTKA